MKLSKVLTTVLFLAGTALVAKASPPIATPWTLAASTVAATSTFVVPTGGASGALAIDNTGPGRIMIKVVGPPTPATPTTPAKAGEVHVEFLKAGKSIGHLGITTGSTVTLIDIKELPLGVPQLGSKGSYCWTP